jgi:glycyl-tRNA synthetase beta chain
MTFPKMMRWGAGVHAFVRPVHGILAVFDREVVPMTVFGVASGDRTVGHRLYADGEIEARGFDEYVSRLRAAGVEPDSEERAALLLERARELAAASGGGIEGDADLIPTLADLVEWPGLVCGSFDPVYLELPEEILVTTMRVHQKYSSVRAAPGAHGELSRGDGPPGGCRGLIVKGNEWVLNARLSDARFFFDEDVREPFSSKMEKLARLQFHEKLGDYLQKTGRVQS